MNMRERFEAEIRAMNPQADLDLLKDGDFGVSLGIAACGDYSHGGVRNAWLGFQLGYQAGAEEMKKSAAKVCADYHKRDPAQDGNGYWAAENCYETIRQLPIEGKI